MVISVLVVHPHDGVANWGYGFLQLPSIRRGSDCTSLVWGKIKIPNLKSVSTKCMSISHHHRVKMQPLEVRDCLYCVPGVPKTTYMSEAY